MSDNKTKGIGDYIVSVLNGMAQGLFASLIIGLIIKQIGTYSGLKWLSDFGQIAQCLTCPAIGIGVAYSIGAKGLALFAAATAGTIGGGAITIAETGAIAIASGEPLGACIAALAGAICGKAITGKTKADIILVPLLTIFAGGITGLLISPVVAALMTALGGGNKDIADKIKESDEEIFVSRDRFDSDDVFRQQCEVLSYADDEFTEYYIETEKPNRDETEYLCISIVDNGNTDILRAVKKTKTQKNSSATVSS